MADSLRQFYPRIASNLIDQTVSEVGIDNLEFF
jgi:hypothetical protein